MPPSPIFPIRSEGKRDCGDVREQERKNLELSALGVTSEAAQIGRNSSTAVAKAV